ncbi:MAG: Fic family protein [Actinomycetota bacterium]|nr:Fic family protein [Actinomycetota bacterium]
MTSHPWITFRLDISRLDWRFWEQLGEARSKCRHLANTPLPPLVAQELSSLYLAKGALATTAIEGNTLNEDQALEAVRGQLKLPLSQEYLGREIENILAACGMIERGVYDQDDQFTLTPERLKELNRQVLDGLDVEDHVVPGEFRRESIAVGGVYRGAPWNDCEFLVAQLCEWLNDPDFVSGENGVDAFLRAFLRAALAHMYIAWIHPFGDGNGRTARLVEFGILTATGIPSVSAHLLSNHYNATRSVYYRQLDYASKSGGRLDRFLRYAVEGFVDELQQQLDTVHGWNFQAAWTNYVHEMFDPAPTVTSRRQRQLVLALPAVGWVPVNSIPTLNPELAIAYADKGRKTVSRDVNALVQRGLVERQGANIRPRREIMLGFLPRLPGQPAI